MLGSVVWSVGSKLAVQLGDDHVHAGPVTQLPVVLQRMPVEVLLWEQSRPPKDHWVWSAESGVRIMLWTLTAPGSWKLPNGWKLTRRRLRHDQLGGVTTRTVTFFQARRVGDTTSPWLNERSHVEQALSQVVDPTLGGRLVPMPDPQQLNTGRGKLEWAARHQRVILPTVYHKTMWAKRRLSSKELSSALDLPGHVRAKLSTNQMRYFNSRVIPGKLLAEAVHMITFPVQESSKSLVLNRKNEENAENAKSHKRQRTHGHVPMDLTTNSSNTPRELKAELKAEMTTVTAKAVKSDDAGVPEYLWNARLVKGLGMSPEMATDGSVCSALSTLRRACLRYWKKKVEREFRTWYGDYSRNLLENVEDEPMFTLPLHEIAARGRETLRHVWKASWWEWDGGSSILFWRWPKPYQRVALEGLPPMFVVSPPDIFEPQPPYTDAGIRAKVFSKVSKVVKKGYIVILPKDTPKGVIKALMYMFDVAKGDNDIRMVYDGSKNGLNAALWAPWFALPTVDSVCRTLLPGCWCGDNDYGEQFLNFPLHRDVQPYCGVDLSQLYPELKPTRKGLVLGVWTRNAMGLRPSPYACVQGALRAKRLILGDHTDEKNPFHWARIELNLPGSSDYDCRLPWLILRRRDGSIATSLHQYIDDLRVTGASPELVWEASRMIGKICAWLGLQDAARKRREPSRSPGAWAGAVVSTDESNTYKTVTQERWNKARARIRWLGSHVGLIDEWSMKNELGIMRSDSLPKAGEPLLHKQAESIRGFLVYVARTFPTMTPFLKGLHLTLDSWRPQRDEEGWRIHTEKGPLGTDPQQEKAPRVVTPVPRLRGDLKVLMELTGSEYPPKVPVRPSEVGVGYLVGDASGSGFGSTLWCAGDTFVGAEFGSWTEETSKQSSNFREALNLVQRLEHLVESKQLQPGMELFVFTDNSTAERAFYNGTSRSKLLHQLVIRLRKLEMAGQLFVHVIWIAGTRMIDQGTDGLSRGDLTSGVLKGNTFLNYVPLSKTVIDRQPTFANWLVEYLPGTWELLSPEGWFCSVFDNPKGNYVWFPPPALANVALEQLCEVKHVHPESNHVFVTPTLFTAIWRKQLRKASDLMTTIPCGSCVWPEEEHEPLTLAFICSLLPHSPWSFRCTAEVDQLGSEMSGMWCPDPRLGGSRLRKFWTQAWARGTSGVSRSLARKVLPTT